MLRVICILVALAAFASLAPASSWAQGPCNLTCSPILGTDEHLAFRAGDNDGWDGGYHEEDPYPGTCCWIDPEDPGCRHACPETEELELTLAAVESALADSDMAALHGLTSMNRSISINTERSSVQVMLTCQTFTEPVTWANLPLSAAQIADLRRLDEEGRKSIGEQQ